MVSNDLIVDSTSEALLGRTIDVVVSGSIGAIESARFIRSLRRLGAVCQPWLTLGGSQFTTATTLTWAAAREARTEFHGHAPHIAEHDACIIAPASANIIGQIAQGLTNTPATALVASYLGQGKPVIILANMHDSLFHSPFVASNLQKLRSLCAILEARLEEGKQKFPPPNLLADRCANLINARQCQKIMLTMGSTQGSIDAVRYISNYSSGALGSRIATEFFRFGHEVHIIAGPCAIRPENYSSLTEVTSNSEMLAAVEQHAQKEMNGAIFAASVLDFVPSQQIQGKVKSSDSLKVEFIRTPKIIAAFKAPVKFKVGFKLEDEGSSPQKQSIAEEYIQKYNLSHLVYNSRQNVSSQSHLAEIFSRTNSTPAILTSKEAIAQHLVNEAIKLFL